MKSPLEVICDAPAKQDDQEPAVSTIPPLDNPRQVQGGLAAGVVQGSSPTTPVTIVVKAESGCQ